MSTFGDSLLYLYSMYVYTLTEFCIYIRMQEKEVLVKEKSELSGLLSELGRELQQAKAQLGEEKKVSHDLATQLEVRKSVRMLDISVPL